MATVGIPSRARTARFERVARTAFGLLDGAVQACGVMLLADAIRDLVSGGGAPVAGAFLRQPGGAPVPSLILLVPGLALLVRSRASAFALTGALVLASANVAELLALRASGLAASPLPFSVAAGFLFAAGIARCLRDRDAGALRPRLAGAVLAAPAFVLGFILCFGASDYARPSEAIVVLGARAYADGTPSLALEDRTAHGVRLWKRGLAPKLVLSGAPDEVPAMVRLARAAGVPAGAIEADPEGVNTRETMRGLRGRRVIAVSHFYHLARVKLAALQSGVTCVTSPCTMTRRLAREPWFVARECVALAAYYLRRG